MKTFALVSTAIVAASTLVAATPTPGWNDWRKGAGSSDKGVFHFSSTYNVVATPGEVVNGTGAASKSTPGQPGAVGYYNFGINSALDTICYNITLLGVTGDYQSPAKTATHLHQAPKGQGGPPRIAFPNPVGNDQIRRSVGCLTGPFTTGILSNGVDTGAGFKVKQIEDNPSAFFCDVHTKMYVPGAVRGQLA